jgi:RHH-type proline utilization regulon transcriptional repressor/proline dehydrogenase/delta 1-pyrroline-5-carboxylate dehydrogenase
MNTREQIDPATLFGGFAEGPPELSELRRRITRAYRLPESEAVSGLLERARMDADTGSRANALALQIAQRLRDRKNAAGRAGLVQGLLQ